MFFERPFIIISFSSRHRVQFRFPFLLAGICLMMAHLIKNCRFSFFRFQMCLDNSVSCLYFMLRLNKDDEKLCNCRQRENCPTDGKCLTKSVVYKAEVTTTDNNARQTYLGVTANDFKTRYRNHLKSLRNEKYKHETELSKHIWNLKKENRQVLIRWAIVKQIPAGRNGKRNCTLCLEEKLMIMKGRSKNILNRRSEMFSKCRHVI